MKAPREIELKLEITAEGLRKLERSELLRGNHLPRKGAELVSVYFDTRRLKLRKRGLSLRVRHMDGRHLQTVKRNEPGNGAALRAFDGKVESMMVDSQDGANQIQHRHWDKGASDEWGSHIPTICANVSLRQSRPVIPVRKLLSCSTWL